MPYVMPPQPTPKQRKYRKHLIRRLKKRGMFIKDANHKGGGTYGLLSPHGKMYIGKSIEYKNRMGKHRWDAYNKKKNGKWKKNKPLYRAIRKWGWDRFELFLFEKHDETRADIDDVLNKQEIALIAEFETFSNRDKGYNLTRGGDGTSGRKATPEQRAYLRQVHNSPEAKAARSAATKKNWTDPVYRAKHSKPVVSKILISGNNPIKEYQLIYHASQTIGAEDLRLLFGMNFSRTCISQVITGRKKRHLNFFFEKYSGAPGQPTLEQPVKRMRVTNI